MLYLYFNVLDVLHVYQTVIALYSPSLLVMQARCHWFCQYFLLKISRIGCTLSMVIVLCFDVLYLYFNVLDILYVYQTVIALYCSQCMCNVCRMSLVLTTPST